MTKTTESGDWDYLEEIYGMSNQGCEKGRLGCTREDTGLLSSLRLYIHLRMSWLHMIPHCRG